jgi:glucose-1-phosphate adenylyltransferase
MDLRAVTPALDLYNLEWPIRTANFNAAPAKFVHDFGDRIGRAINSVVCEGSILSGCLVRDSVVARNTRIHSFAQVEESILMDNVVVGRHARIRRAIVDKNVEIAEGDSIGYDAEKDRERFFVTDSGLVVLPKRRVVEVGLSSLEV